MSWHFTEHGRLRGRSRSETLVQTPVNSEAMPLLTVPKWNSLSGKFRPTQTAMIDQLPQQCTRWGLRYQWRCWLLRQDREAPWALLQLVHWDLHWHSYRIGGETLKHGHEDYAESPTMGYHPCIAGFQPAAVIQLGTMPDREFDWDGGRLQKYQEALEVPSEWSGNHSKKSAKAEGSWLRHRRVEQVRK